VTSHAELGVRIRRRGTLCERSGGLNRRAGRITTLERPARRPLRLGRSSLLDQHGLHGGHAKLLLTSRRQLEDFNGGGYDDGNYVVQVVWFTGTPIMFSAARAR